MTYKDLSNFTYKELRFFTYADISLDKYELIAKAENQSIDLPEDIQKKLRSLCTELANHHPNQEPLFKNFSCSAPVTAEISKAAEDVGEQRSPT